MSHIAEPLADNTLNKANAIGKRSKNGRADQTEIVNASMKNNLVRVRKAENKMMPATTTCDMMPSNVKKKNPSSGVQVISLSNVRRKPVGKRII